MPSRSPSSITKKALLPPDPDGFIIGLSTAVFTVQNISMNVSLNSPTRYWSIVLFRCVMILVRLCLWSWERSAVEIKIRAIRFGERGKRSRCCCLWSPIASLCTACIISSVHGITTWLLSAAWRAACALLWAFLLAVTSATIAGEVRSSSGHKSIQDSSSLLPSIWNLVIHFINSAFPRLFFINRMNL